MKKTLIFMATHIIDECVIREYDKIQKSGYDSVLFVDNHKEIVNGGGYFSYNNKNFLWSKC